MERYFSKTPKPIVASSMEKGENSKKPIEQTQVSPKKRKRATSSPRKIDVEINAENVQENIQADPGLRIPILDYPPNIRDQVRRAYLLKGPCQPKAHSFPSTNFGTTTKPSRRAFRAKWFDEFCWLEYSLAKDAAYCLWCYLFKPNVGDQSGGNSFVGEGFTNWRKKNKLTIHVGDHMSPHNKSRRNCETLMNQAQQIETHFTKQVDKAKKDNRTRLTASINAIRYLLRQGLSFRGHDESVESKNQGNFLELMKYSCKLNADINAVALDNAPGNLKMTSGDIQKQIVQCIATEVVEFIVKDIGDSFFSILVDESRDVSVKEQMAVILRYVDRRGNVIERFIGVVHVAETTAALLKKSIDSLFASLGLSISKLRGQGYDGASNMRGEFNGLKTLILKENEFAFYVHCFAHQLQLALVAVAKKHDNIMSLFMLISNVVNIVGASCKRRDILRDIQVAKVSDALSKGEIQSGHGLNQMTSLQRPGDTRWGSHYRTLISLCNMFSAVIEVLEIVATDALTDQQRFEAKVLVDSLHTFDFTFSLHLMKLVLGFANELSVALQRKDQDIVNAMSLVKVCKQRLQITREEGWESLINEVSLFCEKHGIDVPDMNDTFVAQFRSQRRAHKKTNLHHYRVELFFEVIDLQLHELNGRFSEATTEQLLCLSCLNPDDAFAAFEVKKLLRLARFYPKEFSTLQLIELENQLGTYILDVQSSTSFNGLKGVSELAKKMVETKKDKVYPLVYLLVTLALILPVATASVERAFSAMNIIKTSLRNRMEDQWMNDNMVVYIEKDIVDQIDNETVIQRFQKMKNRRGQL